MNLTFLIFLFLYLGIFRIDQARSGTTHKNQKRGKIRERLGLLVIQRVYCAFNDSETNENLETDFLKSCALLK